MGLISRVSSRTYRYEYLILKKSCTYWANMYPSQKRKTVTDSSGVKKRTKQKHSASSDEFDDEPVSKFETNVFLSNHPTKGLLSYLDEDEDLQGLEDIVFSS